MTRVRLSIVAIAFVLVGLASARAQDPPPSGRTPGMEVPAAPAAPAEPGRGPVRGFFHRVFTGGKKTPRSAHSDWTTGRDDKLSKPWLR